MATPLGKSMRLSELVKTVAKQLLFSGSEENEEGFLFLLEENNSAIGLDCGCSDGRLTQRIQAKTRAKNIVGIELSQDALLARAKITVCMADLNKGIPFKDESFDFITASYIIEHLYNTDMFIQEIYRTLKRKGYVLIATDNLASFKIIIPLVLGLHPPTCSFSYRFFAPNPFTPEKLLRYRTSALNHLRLFTARVLRGLLEANGFQVMQIEPVGYFPFPSRIAKLLNRIDRYHCSYFYIKARKS